MKRGQMHGEPFVYIMTLLVMGLLLYFGISWVKGLLEKQQIIELTRFKNNMEATFETICYGCSEQINEEVPGIVRRTCFVDTSRTFNYALLDLCKSGTTDYDPLMCNAWMDNASSILFSPPLEIDISIGAIRVDSVNGYLCFNTARNQRVKFTLTGLGTIAKVSP